MNDEPVNWFYGLMAERAAEFTPKPHQLPFFQREIERFGQPVLDLGCGVGPLLLPLLRSQSEGAGSVVSTCTGCDSGYVGEGK